MEVVKEQKLPLYEVSCKYCKTVFRFNKHELQTTNATGLFGLPLIISYIQCPICKTKLVHDLKSLEKFLVKEDQTEEKPTPPPTTPEDPKPEKDLNTIIDERFKKSFNDCMDAFHKFGEAVKCTCDKVIDETPTEQTTTTPDDKEAGVKEIAILKVRTNTTELEKEIYTKLIKKYDKQQIIVAIEELSELQKELCKHLREQTNEKAIIEEICDVQIMLEQIILYFGISVLDLDTEKRFKLERTKERLLADEEKEV